jgi:hypothetical protein
MVDSLSIGTQGRMRGGGGGNIDVVIAPFTRFSDHGLGGYFFFQTKLSFVSVVHREV